MIPSLFDYQKASSLDDALSSIGDEETKLLAGGHSLLPVMKLRLSSPSKVVDIGHLAELNYIKEDGGQIAIGATTTHHQIATSDLVQQKAPALAQAAGLIGDVQVRNRGTIGGSVAHADPAADYPGALLALEAEVVVQNSSGKRTIQTGDFFIDLFETALASNEAVVEVRVPINAANQNSCYLKFPQPASRFPIVGCAVALENEGGVCREVRVGFSGVANAAFRDSGVENEIRGQAISEKTISSAASKAAEGVSILEDMHASQDYRKHLSKVFAKRALTQAGS